MKKFVLEVAFTCFVVFLPVFPLMYNVCNVDVIATDMFALQHTQADVYRM